MSTQEPIESTVLGHKTEYPKSYAPQILVAVPRRLNRAIYGIDSQHLPFVGVDIWHAYELSFLTEHGLPVQGLLKLRIPADSEALVESKSLKLYLNSLNMERFGATPDEGISFVLQIIKDDLSQLLSANIDAHVFMRNALSFSDFDNYQIIEDTDGIDEMTFRRFVESPDELGSPIGSGELRVGTNLLRSNCKITRQPDWGSAFVRMKGGALPDAKNLLRYIVSLRNENHFHEEICELIFIRLLERFAPAELSVSCIYTRRGGIDICPSRATSPNLLPTHLTDVSQLSTKLLRQ